MKKRDDGRWRQKITIDGVPKYFYGRTKAELKRKIDSYREQQAKSVAFDTIADLYEADAFPRLSKTTQTGYLPALNRARTHFQGVPITDIRPIDIRSYVSTLSHERNLSYKTAKNQMMVINLVFRYAVDNGYIDINPAVNLVPDRNLPRRVRTLPMEDDLNRVKKSGGCYFGLFALMALYTGGRRGELLALTWNDIDLKERTITISKSAYRDGSKVSIKEPKTKAGVRVVPILDALLPYLKGGKGLVFPSKDGGYITESSFRRKWERYQKESGVTCTPHQLRHAYATMLFENNVPEADAQELLGHAQISTTMDIYTHLREEHKKKVRDGLWAIDI